MNATLERQEQYSRRNLLLIHGVDEIEGEDTDKISTKVLQEYMNQIIKISHIDVEIQKKSINAKPRPIIVKYARYNARNIIYRNKKVLKGKGISVTESLTAKWIKMLKKTRELYGFINVWSQYGKIVFFDKVINKVNVSYNSNISDVTG